IRAQLLHLQPAKDNVNSLTTVVDEFERGVCQLEQLGANIDDESLGHCWKPNSRAVASQARCMRAAESALAAMREPERRPEKRMVPFEHGARAGRDGCQMAFMVRDNPRPEAQNRRTDGAPPTQRPEQFENRNGSSSRRVPHDNWNGSGQMGPVAGGCSLCGQPRHLPSRCPKFSSVQTRRARLIEQRRCLRCLSSTHTAQHCQRGHPCRWCNHDDHHWIICGNGPKGEQLPEQRQSRAERPNRTVIVQESAGRRGSYLPCATTKRGPSSPATSQNRTHEQVWTESPPVGRPERESPSLRDNEQRAFTTVGQRLPAYLMVCPVMVAAENGKSECQATLLLDPGSHVDCADAALIRQLNPEKTGSAPLEIQVFGGKKLKMPSGKYRLRLKRTDGGWESLEVSEVEKICTPIRTELISPGATPDRFQTTTVTTQPQLLIGIRKFWDFVQGFRKSEEGAYLIDTVFGTILCGEQFQATTGVPPDPTVFTIAPCGDDERERMPYERKKTKKYGEGKAKMAITKFEQSVDEKEAKSEKRARLEREKAAKKPTKSDGKEKRYGMTAPETGKWPQRNWRAKEIRDPDREMPKRGKAKKQWRPRIGLCILAMLMCLTGTLSCQPSIRSAGMDAFPTPKKEAPCAMECAARGVTVSRDYDVDKLEICGPDGCWRLHPEPLRSTTNYRPNN
uniref:Integrase catalytic domain-containing protein n=1 Tax=Globodera pallida TaxID=36090 RepID=A0A183CQD8_GLOPA